MLFPLLYVREGGCAERSRRRETVAAFPAEITLDVSLVRGTDAVTPKSAESALRAPQACNFRRQTGHVSKLEQCLSGSQEALAILAGNIYSVD
jgi:hypothetical protein